MSDVKTNVGADGRTLTEYPYNTDPDAYTTYYTANDLAAMSLLT